MSISNSESSRIADQLRFAFNGEAWHGPALLELLKDVDAATAASKPLKNVHSIWELVLHIEVWDAAASRRLEGKITQPEGTDNFPIPPEPTKENWKNALNNLARTHNALVETLETLPDTRLQERVPGKDYDFYHNLHGVVQHELYHAGQIAILKKARVQR